MHLRIILVHILLLFAASVSGQIKYEKEYRLKPQDIPLEARQFVDSFQFQKKVRWYFEENFKGNSMEAKVRSNQKKYSIEFDTLGNLQDIEIQISWGEIPQATRNTISSELDSIYSNFKINKIQVQYKGDNAALLSLEKKPKPDNRLSTKYEIIVRGRKGNQVKLYEITFTQNGKFIESAEIIFRNTDNLVY